MAQPVLSYPGAKWRFYPHMVEYFPVDMRTFIEPFFGGGSVSLSVLDDTRFTKLERVIGGDLYTEIWAFWNGIKNNPQAVIEIAEKWFREKCKHQPEVHNSGFHSAEARKYLQGGELENYKEVLNEDEINSINYKISLYEVACEEGKKFWDWAQSIDTTTLSLEERAARMFLVNKISFSGMGDSGSLSKDNYCSFSLDKLDRIKSASKILNSKDVQIINKSFEETMKFAYQNPESTFVFLDPPYYRQEESGLYGKGGGTHKGFPHEKFAEETKKLPCKWFVTYDDSVAVRKMFSGNTFDNKEITLLPFTIPGGYTMAIRNSEDALKGEELFISNYTLDEEVDDF